MAERIIVTSDHLKLPMAQFQTATLIVSNGRIVKDKSGQRLDQPATVETIVAAAVASNCPFTLRYCP